VHRPSVYLAEVVSVIRTFEIIEIADQEPACVPDLPIRLGESVEDLFGNPYVVLIVF
jgi:hypothetical protein